jgi:hypothetical protein
MPLGAFRSGHPLEFVNTCRLPITNRDKSVDPFRLATHEGSSALTAQERPIWLAASIRSVRWSSSALVKDVAQMLPEEKLGAPPREAMCAARP